MAYMKQQENMIMKYQFDNYYFLYRELSNELPNAETTMIVPKMVVSQTF